MSDHSRQRLASELDRRRFLRAAGLGGLGVASALLLTACPPAGADSEGEEQEETGEDQQDDTGEEQEESGEDEQDD